MYYNFPTIVETDSFVRSIHTDLSGCTTYHYSLIDSIISDMFIILIMDYHL